MKKILALVAIILTVPFAHAQQTIFDNIPDTLAPNYSSLGYEATSTSEWGTQVNVGGSSWNLDSATVTMSTWAGRDDSAFGGPNYAAMGIGNATGYNYTLTFNVYAAVAGGSITPGALLGYDTQTFHIPWRPVATGVDSTAPYYTVGGNNYHGYAFNVTFDLSSLGIVVPNQFVWTVSYNTADYGQMPNHIAGPWNSLNVGAEGIDPPSVGSYTNPDVTLLNSSWIGAYGDPSNGAGFLHTDPTWTGYQTMGKITAEAVPEPCSMLAVGVGLLGILKRKRA
jgi:hypothetical protein